MKKWSSDTFLYGWERCCFYIEACCRELYCLNLALNFPFSSLESMLDDFFLLVHQIDLCFIYTLGGNGNNQLYSTHRQGIYSSKDLRLAWHVS